MASKVSRKPKYEKYKNNKTKEKNKVRKLTKYLKSSPNDLQAQKRLSELQKLI